MPLAWLAATYRPPHADSRNKYGSFRCWLPQTLDIKHHLKKELLSCDGYGTLIFTYGPVDLTAKSLELANEMMEKEVAVTISWWNDDSWGRSQSMCKPDRLESTFQDNNSRTFPVTSVLVNNQVLIFLLCSQTIFSPRYCGYHIEIMDL